jgi:hypothetical protein
MTRLHHQAVKPQTIQDVRPHAHASELPSKPVGRKPFLRRQPKLPKLSRKQLVLLSVSTVVLLGGVGGVVIMSRNRVASIPTRFGQVLPVKPYHPDKLPKNVTFNASETTTEQGALITKFTDTTGKGSLFLTQQKRPNEVDLKQIDTQETYLANAGSVYFLKGEKDRIQAIIETEELWILVDGPASFDNARAKELISRLRPQP